MFSPVMAGDERLALLPTDHASILLHFLFGDKTRPTIPAHETWAGTRPGPAQVPYLPRQSRRGVVQLILDEFTNHLCYLPTCWLTISTACATPFSARIFSPSAVARCCISSSVVA